MFILDISNNITLRMLSARDAEPLFQLIDQSKEHLKAWLPWINDTKSPEDSLNFIKGSFEIYNNRQGITAGVFYNEALVGVISFNTLDWNANIGTIGYWLSQHITGKGIMTKSVIALTNYGFSELRLNRIEIRAAEHNYASRSIPERIGYKQEGHLRDAEWLYDYYVDHIVYGILKSEWKELNS